MNYDILDKEQIINILNDTLECVDKQVKEIERLQDMDKILRNENINLKLRINKAIKYIEEHREYYYKSIFDTNEKIFSDEFDKKSSTKELLQILKGSDKE